MFIKQQYGNSCCFCCYRFKVLFSFFSFFAVVLSIFRLLACFVLVIFKIVSCIKNFRPTPISDEKEKTRLPRQSFHHQLTPKILPPPPPPKAYNWTYLKKILCNLRETMNIETDFIKKEKIMKGNNYWMFTLCWDDCSCTSRRNEQVRLRFATSGIISSTK